MNTFYLFHEDMLPHITYIGYNQTEENWKHFRRATHEHILYVIQSGEMFLEENNIAFHLQPGDALLLEAGKEHVGYKNSACSYAFFHLSQVPVTIVENAGLSWQQEQIHHFLELNYQESPLSHCLYRDLPIVVPKYFHMEQPDSVHRMNVLIQEAVTCSQSRRMHYKLLSSCRLMEVFSLLSKAWMDSTYLHAQTDISSVMYDKTNQLLDFLHRCYSRKITSQLLEQSFSMNFDYMNRIFKRRTGTTIFSYLNQLRLEQAKQLLATTWLTLGEIASQTGFSDEYYFSRVFKKSLKITPAAYRKQWSSPVETSSNFRED